MDDHGNYTATPENFTLANDSTGHYLTPQGYSAGGSSAGPNNNSGWLGDTPPLQVNQTSGTTQILKTYMDTGLPAGSTVGAEENTKVSICGGTDVTKHNCSASMPSGSSVTVKIYVQAWQAANLTSTDVCAGTGHIDTQETRTISYWTHHDTSALVVAKTDSPLVLSSACPSRVYVKSQFVVVTSGGMVYITGQGSDVGVFG